MSILVTGGLGYIGSHVARLIEQQGEKVVIVDDLSSGEMSRLSDARLVELDIASPEATEILGSTMRQHDIRAVVHLAGKKQVGESVLRPEWYYQQNVQGLANLLVAMRDNKVSRLVFSSSAATYGMPDVATVNEDYDCHPINPYGETKLIGEWMVSNATSAWGLRGTNLRYFNVAGTGWPELADTAVSNLVPIVFAAMRDNVKPAVFGADYDTPDGSCIRDYVHVLDLAEAHLRALDYLDQDERPYSTFNVGTGQGSSVFEVLDEIRKVSGNNFEAEILPRRAGDPPALAADVTRIRETLGWNARFGLKEIIESAWSAV